MCRNGGRGSPEYNLFRQKVLTCRIGSLHYCLFYVSEEMNEGYMWHSTALVIWLSPVGPKWEGQ